MPLRNMDRDSLRMIRWIEAINAVASSLLVLLLLAACFMLDRQTRYMSGLEEQLRIRNAQGQTAVGLLGKAVDRLEKLQQPLAVHPVPDPLRSAPPPGRR